MTAEDWMKLELSQALPVRVAFAALVVELIRAGMVDALEDLWEWAEEHLDVNREQLEEELGIDA